MDTRLQKIVGEMAKKEKNLKLYKSRRHVKGEVIKKSKTKSGNIKLRVLCENNKYTFIIIKSHKDRFALAERLKKGDFVSICGYPKFRWVLCTRLSQIKNLDKSSQINLEKF